MIKTQVKEITSILEFISKYNFSPKDLFDYYDLLIVNLNVYLYDLEKPNNAKKIKSELEEKIGGWIVFTEKAKSKFVYVNGSYSDFEKTFYEFEQKRFSHDSDVLSLKGFIRVYLRIDDKWR